MGRGTPAEPHWRNGPTLPTPTRPPPDKLLGWDGVTTSEELMCCGPAPAKYFYTEKALQGVWAELGLIPKAISKFLADGKTFPFSGPLYFLLYKMKALYWMSGSQSFIFSNKTLPSSGAAT